MRSMVGHRLLRVILVGSLLLYLQGCYYMQAARGQFEVMRKRESITEVIGSDATSPELAARLRLVDEARNFSITELGLPNNNSYRSYADLERDYVLWNVIAAPEFSLEPKRWCYPIVGCVSYRGYFSETSARRKAGELGDAGYDVVFGGIAAYSTLGRFSDPILNTMMHWDDVDLVAVMFHELAHQLIYVKDDSGFNESFATAVEEFGLERWLASRGQQAEIAEYHMRRDLNERLMQLVVAARDDLEAIYTAELDVATRRERKRQRLAMLSHDAHSVFESEGRSAPKWWSDDLNNARLATMTMYQGLLPAFRRLLDGCGNDLACFYAEVKSLSKLDKQARDVRLNAA